MLNSTEATGSWRVPDALAELLGSTRAPVAMAAGASGSATRVGRPRGQTPLAAKYGPGHAPRAPPARRCPARRRAGKRMLGRLASAQRSAIPDSRSAERSTETLGVPTARIAQAGSAFAADIAMTTGAQPAALRSRPAAD